MAENLPSLEQFDIETGADKGAKLELLDKFGKKSGEWIMLLGEDSQTYQQKLAEHNQNRIQRLAARQVGLGGMKFTQDDVRTEMIERLVAVTREWSFKLADGQPFPCTPDNIEKVYRKSAVIREQVEAFVNERSNFLAG